MGVVLNMVVRGGVTKKVTSGTKMRRGGAATRSQAPNFCTHKAFYSGLVWPRWIFYLCGLLGGAWHKRLCPKAISPSHPP